jgi:two-component system chemotaxis response regulator CheB
MLAEKKGRRMARTVVIGASQGGLQALHTLVSGLKQPFLAPILVVQHIGTSPSILPSVLEDLGFTASFAHDGEPVVNGHIHVAPPDRHMLLRDGVLELSRGPRENYARPAIDPLFRSAALAHGPGAIGIVLSGRLNDGTAGLYEIKRYGGTAIVQTPAEAEAPDMPRSALENVPVDYCLPVADIARLIERLVQEAAAERDLHYQRMVAMDLEPRIVKPAAQTCPECGGAMREERVGSLTRFVCHIGHSMTAEVLAASQMEKLEQDISALLRQINERVGLCRDMAEKHSAAGRGDAARIWAHAAEEAARREAALKELVKLPWNHPESEEPPAAAEPAA